MRPESTEFEKIYVAKYANLQAAITCNHKKGVNPKNPASITATSKYEESLKKKIEIINDLKADLKDKNWKTENQKSRLIEKGTKARIPSKVTERDKGI